MESTLTSPSPDATGATLTVDLGALRANYRQLQQLSAPARCAAAVKADAYGTGLEPVVQSLAAAGCDTFFVAQPWEGERVRKTLPEALIYVLNGFAEQASALYRDLALRPVLGTLEEISDWSAFCGQCGARLAAAVHVDTGINRLGLSPDEVDTLAAAEDLCNAFEWALVMSHLARADEPDAAMNRRQAELFQDLRARLPAAPASLANSGGVLNGADYHHDIVRPGIALYGGNPRPGMANPMRRVVFLESRILQVRDVPEGGSVGYGATWRARRPSRIAIVPVGYGDGWFRRLFDPDTEGRAGVFVEGSFAPLAGRVSMDMITVDVTDIASDKVHRGTKVELLGENITVDDVARWAGTISYEVLTALGTRYAREYCDQAPDPS